MNTTKLTTYGITSMHKRIPDKSSDKSNADGKKMIRFIISHRYGLMFSKYSSIVSCSFPSLL